LSLERLDGKDVRVLLIWILAGLAGAGVAHKYFFRAFPEASVDFKVPRADALEQARQFAGAQGARLDGYDSSVVFNVDDTAKTYLEREVGLENANRMMRETLHIWYWQTRFFRPLQKEEFDVRIDPAGGAVGYSHVLEETALGAHLERAPAQAAAESFLRDTQHLDLSRYEFREEEANSTERPNRRDWSFSWELRGFRAKDAPYRLNVTLAGDRVNGYNEFLKVPEAWERGYQRLRESNNLFEFIALIPYAFLIGGCLYVIISLGRRGAVEWRAGLLLSAVLAALFFLMTMNQWPMDRAAYDTNTPYSSFFLSQVGKAALTSVLSAVLVLLAIVPGEPFYRLSQPGKIRIGAGLRLAGIRTKEFFTANVIGICLAAAQIGYITVFYIVSGKLGAWAPQDLQYSDIVSTPLPWVSALTIGIYAATSEEFLFRLFAIPYIQRITKSRFLAVVLPAFAWGFLHSNYPQEPAYIRGIEVGLMGIVAGLVMLRWGIWATLIWHYTVDAFLISTSLLRSHGAYLQVSGAVVGCGALIPLSIAAYFYLSRGGFEPAAALLNSVEPVGGYRPYSPQASPEESAQEDSPDLAATGHARAYSAMSARTLGVLAVCGLAGVALLAGVKREAIGDFVRFQIDAREATARADQALRDRKIDPATWRHAATIAYTFDGFKNEYLRRTIGIPAANRVYREQVPSAFWSVRYFRDSQAEEYSVIVKPDGSLHSVHHTLDEKAPGANLSKQEALARAEAFLRDEKKMDPSLWKLVDAQTEQKPARADHTFEWEQIAALDAAAGQQGAHTRVRLQVQGDEVSGYRIFIKIPQAWLDAESRDTPGQLARTYALYFASYAILIGVLIILIRSLKRPEMARVPWRRLTKWSLWVLAAAILTLANQSPQVLAEYATTTPLAMYFASQSILRFFGLSIDFAGAVLILGIAWFFLERGFGPGRIPSWTGMPAAYHRDALCVAAFGSAAMLGLSRLPGLFARWPLLRHTLAASVPGNLDALNPASATFASAVVSSFFLAGLLGLAAGLIAAYVRPQWMRVGLLVLYAVVITSNVATPGAFLRDAAYHLIAASVLWAGVTRIVRFNAMGYFLACAMIALVPAALDLLQQPNSYFHANGYIVVTIALAILAWPAIHWRRGVQ
jgi:membrane protease YdiL (CAAX protease family)